MKKVITMCITFLLLFSILSPKALAHELYLQVNEYLVEDELTIDIMWGHIRDFVDEGNYEHYELFVRYPNGEIKELEVQKNGVSGRSQLLPDEDGEYIFWAIRKPGTHTPEGGVTTLSNQQAKIIYQHGNGAASNNPAINMNLEIIPSTDLSQYSTGTFSGTVHYEGDPTEEIIIVAYGPKGEVLEAKTDGNGEFTFPLESVGEWLLKANVSYDELGMLEDTEFQRVSNTSTLLIETTGNQPSSSSSLNITQTIIVFLIGLLFGISFTYLAVSRRK